MLEGERNAPKFIYIAYVANIPQMKFVLQKPCLQCMIWLKIMVRPPQLIVLVPKGSPNEKFLKKFDARGWTKRSEVYVYSENHTKWSLKPCLQCMKWLNIMIRPPQPIVLVPKVSLIEKFKKKILILEGEPSAPKFIYIAYVVNIPPNEVCASKTVPAMHDMTQNPVQTPSAHCFGPKGFTKWKILKTIWC